MSGTIAERMIVAADLPAKPTPATRLADLLPPDKVTAALADPPPRLAPAAEDHDRWAQVSVADRAEILATAEELADRPWPILLASEYARFHQEGNRVGYEEPYFERRTRLTAVTLAAALTGDPRWLTEAVDGISLICDELAWTVPAHSWKNRERDSAVPSPDDCDLDLFAAETGSVLAWTDHVLGAALDGYASTIRPRLRAEVNRRVLEPYRTRRDWHWLTTSINNWNPWIHSNVLACAFLLDLAPETRAEIVNLTVDGLDLFLDTYPVDGGCDEGASYWGRAGGSLGDCLALLHDATGGRLNGFTHPKVAPIARYFPAVHIADDWYVNFADGPARLQERTLAAPVHRLGVHTGDDLVLRHAAMINTRGGRLIGRLASFGRVLQVIFTPELRETGPDRPADGDHFWFPDTEVITARLAGLTLAAKGGHNAESHNHNDVGNVVVAVDGVPRVVDLGVGTYTRQTFSPGRYQIFTMQSEFHNLPVINGYGQLPGRDHRSRGMTADVTADRVQASLDLADAYPAEAGLESWIRDTALTAEGAVITDRWKLDVAPTSLVWHLIVNGTATVEPGAVRVAGDEGRGVIITHPAAAPCTAEPVPLPDPRLSQVWGPELTRLTFTGSPDLLQPTGELILTVSPG
ncbi:heparinase II/III domain-containing protein [Microlunatus parietis]|uniref:Heparinase II/III-like C-terminal domain-containing protein n=1 Tax=Microlunatus parietis TaxID=682979 RepID=A0A7Y9LCV4_9ACTN|nr:heparinase II/III family protein [Microlunatus parietis]NYE73217.1 hypothetical protein [Microlunatus parietis]